MRVDVIDEQDVNRIADRLQGEYRLIWLIGTTTGLRISDILTLKVYQCMSKKAYIIERKTGKKRVVYIRKGIRDECLKLARKRGCKDKEKIFTVSRQSVWKSFKNAAKKEGIYTNIGTHTMRKSYSVSYIKKGHTIHELQKRLNHSHIGDTIGYITSNSILGLDGRGRKEQKRKDSKK